MSREKDNWDSHTYSTKVAPFVPVLTSKVVALLDPQPTDTILDIGCGDGILTAQLSEKCHHITGLDSSGNMVSSAKASYSTLNTTYAIQDCRNLSSLQSNHYSKIFSNAAFHWILRCPTSVRSQIFSDCFRALNPGGKLVAEMGGHGNVAEVHAALISALMHRGFSAEEARAASPWFFPDENEIRGLLEGAGFKVEMTEAELRQTVLTGEAGLEGWVRLFGASFLEVVRDEEREIVVKEVCDVLESVGRRADGKFVLGYIRLRFVGIKEE